MAWVFPVVGNTEWSGGSWMPNQQTHRGRTHPAIDIYASRGQTIVSPVSGRVRSVGSGAIGGNWIRITGDDGHDYYVAHMDAPTTLKKGQQISGGTAIGAVGNSGSASSTSPHLHFSMKKGGIAISPINFLKSGVVVPDMEKAITGVGAGLDTGESTPTPTKRPKLNEIARGPEAISPEAQGDVPAWYQQLIEYREQMANTPQEDPVKFRAREVMRGTLEGMSNMVRRASFNTGMGTDTGIDEGNMISREGER